MGRERGETQRSATRSAHERSFAKMPRHDKRERSNKLSLIVHAICGFIDRCTFVVPCPCVAVVVSFNVNLVNNVLHYYIITVCHVLGKREWQCCRCCALVWTVTRLLEYRYGSIVLVKTSHCLVGLAKREVVRNCPNASHSKSSTLC